jgi:myo-inositol 2-dehydrogenase/D-chiro-inositol 1-dehydrogenase
MNKIRIGSVGLGRPGLRHTENIAGKIQNVELVALCGMDKPKLEKTADPLGIPWRNVRKRNGLWRVIDHQDHPLNWRQ